MPIWKRWYFWVGIVIAAAIIGIIFGEDEEVADPVEKEEVEETEKQEEPELTFDEKVEKIIHEELGEETNTGLERIETLDAIEDNGKDLFIVLNANENLTAGMTKASILSDTKDLFSTLFELDIDVVDLSWQLKLQDEYGQEELKGVMDVIFREEEAEKVVWENVQRDKIPELAEQYWIHPAIK